MSLDVKIDTRLLCVRSNKSKLFDFIINFRQLFFFCLSSSFTCESHANCVQHDLETAQEGRLIDDQAIDFVIFKS